METESIADRRFEKMTLAILPTPFKTLATCLIVTLAFGMLGAAGQIIVHDIIPTFYSGVENKEEKIDAEMQKSPPSTSASDRGDLFADLAVGQDEEDTPFYKDELFVWMLKWSHIHLFGINMIFIFLGAVTALMDASAKFRVWLIVLPFIGVLIDILAMWLKGFVSDSFFWLHVPGGGIFVCIFIYVSLRALWEMWIKPA